MNTRYSIFDRKTSKNTLGVERLVFLSDDRIDASDTAGFAAKIRKKKKLIGVARYLI